MLCFPRSGVLSLNGINFMIQDFSIPDSVVRFSETKANIKAFPGVIQTHNKLTNLYPVPNDMLENFLL